jgi:hypothetical protein
VRQMPMPPTVGASMRVGIYEDSRAITTLFTRGASPGAPGSR